MADTIILAVPFGEHREALASWKGKTVIDAMNALVPPEELDSLPSSAFVAKAFTGAKFVKGFNHLIAATVSGAKSRASRLNGLSAATDEVWEVRNDR